MNWSELNDNPRRQGAEASQPFLKALTNRTGKLSVENLGPIIRSITNRKFVGRERDGSSPLEGAYVVADITDGPNKGKHTQPNDKAGRINEILPPERQETTLPRTQVYEFSPSEEYLRIDRRRKLISPIIDRLLTTKTWEQSKAATGSEITIDGEEDNKTRLIDDFASSHVPEDKLDQHIAVIYSAAQALQPVGSEVRVSDMKKIAMHADTVEDGRLYEKFAQKWRDRFLTPTEDRMLSTRKQDFLELLYDMSPRVNSSTHFRRSEGEMTELFDTFSDVCDTAYSLPSDPINERIGTILMNGAKRSGLEWRTAEQPRKLLQIFHRTTEHASSETYTHFIDAVAKYSEYHELTHDAVLGLSEKLLPAMEANDPQLKIIQQSDLVWAKQKGEFCAPDFLTHCFTSRVSPAAINELIMISREIPTSEYERLRQNTVDGYTLGSAICIELRDFIHGQRPALNELIRAMIDYYETGNDAQVRFVLSSNPDDYEDYFDGDANLLLDKSKYEEKIEERKVKMEDEGATIKPIEVLKRLEKNTRPVEQKPPQSSDPELNSLLRELDGASESRKEALHRAFEYVNNGLMEMMQRGEIGIDPNHIHVYSWLERQAFRVLQGIKFEEQMTAYRQPWFHSILRFQELTCSSLEFNKSEFDQFLSNVSHTVFGQPAYQLISHRLFGNTDALQRSYREKGEAHRAKMLMSGDVSHELVNLVNAKPAETAVGRRLRRDFSRLGTDNLRGHGD